MLALKNTLKNAIINRRMGLACLLGSLTGILTVFGAHITGYLPFLCLFPMLPYSFSYIEEKHSGYLKYIRMRISRRKYILCKISGVGLSGGVTMVVSLAVSLIVGSLVPALSSANISLVAVLGDRMKVQMFFGMMVQSMTVSFLFGAVWALIALCMSVILGSRFLTWFVPFMMYQIGWFWLCIERGNETRIGLTVGIFILAEIVVVLVVSVGTAIVMSVALKNSEMDIGENFKENFGREDFEKKQITGIIGRSGTGKTVFLDRLYYELKQETKTAVGAMIGRAGFLKEKTGFDNLYDLACLAEYGSRKNVDSKTTCRNQVNQVLRQVGLWDGARKRVSDYTPGMKQRLGIAQAIMAGEDVWLLDEPMNFLDDDEQLIVQKLLCELKKDRTIVLTSHGREEIQGICDEMFYIGTEDCHEVTPEKAVKFRRVNPPRNRKDINRA